MVASGFFHPESLIYRFPHKRFIGMPLQPERFEDFRARSPEYRMILWHGFSVQNELGRYFRTSGRYEVLRSGASRWRVGSDTTGEFGLTLMVPVEGGAVVVGQPAFERQRLRAGAQGQQEEHEQGDAGRHGPSLPSR